MSLKLNLEPASPIIGYRNLSIHGQNPLCEKANWTDLSKLGVADGTVDEIRASHIIGKIHFSQLGAILQQWLTKLAPNGMLWLESVDSILVGNKMASNAFNLKELNDVVYGQPPIANTSIYAMNDIKIALTEIGFFVETAEFNDFVFQITARKPIA